MRSQGVWLAVLAACATTPSQPARVAAAPPASAPTAAPPAPAPRPPAPTTPAGKRAASLRSAAVLLEQADAMLARGNKTLAEELFSEAELAVGPEALADLAPVFRTGAPPRVAGPTMKVDPGAAAQPKVVGSSEQEDAEANVKPPKVEGKLTGVLQIDGKPLSGTFGLVTLEPASGKWKPRSPKHRTVEQRDRAFSPHVLAVPVGSTVSFPNFDSVFHNVFTTSPLGPFDLGIYKSGEAREVTFNKEGIIRLGCNLHAAMSAYIVVVAAPAYVVTDDAGHFAFEHLAPGKYKLRAWSERSQSPITQDVVIKPGANEVTVGVAADAPTGNQPDKFGGKRG